ncbi:MAG: hypothetical protein ACR2H3_08690 [Acidimicrobiales bacterium]
MRRVLLCAALLAGCVVLTASPASACSCAGVEDQAALAQADAAFEGVVVEKREPPSGPGMSSADPALWVFRVTKVYKGEVAETQGVISPTSGASCGLELGGPGTRALVFAAGTPGRGLPSGSQEGALFANLCNGTRSLGDAATAIGIDEIGQPIPGEVGLASNRRMAVGVGWAAALVLLGSLLGLAAIIRRRSRGRAPVDSG